MEYRALRQNYTQNKCLKIHKSLNKLHDILDLVLEFN